jgi:hypothetical protein
VTKHEFQPGDRVRWEQGYRRFSGVLVRRADPIVSPGSNWIIRITDPGTLHTHRMVGSEVNASEAYLTLLRPPRLVTLIGELAGVVVCGFVTYLAFQTATAGLGWGLALLTCGAVGYLVSEARAFLRSRHDTTKETDQP